MRQARLKPDYQDTWHHCYNRTVGTRSDRPFGDAEKEMFVRMLKRLAAFYSVRVVSPSPIVPNTWTVEPHAPPPPELPQKNARSTKKVSVLRSLRSFAAILQAPP